MYSNHNLYMKMLYLLVPRWRGFMNERERMSQLLDCCESGILAAPKKCLECHPLLKYSFTTSCSAVSPPSLAINSLKPSDELFGIACLEE
jgi:hypothetical protein